MENLKNDIVLSEMTSTVGYTFWVFSMLVLKAILKCSKTTLRELYVSFISAFR